MVRFLAHSCVKTTDATDEDNQPTIVVWEYNENWEHCKHDTYLEVQDQSQRVVIGIGPSGCGKSTIADAIIQCVKEIKDCWTIDGGISREHSIVWRIATLTKKKVPIISNLYDLFKKNEPKKAVLEFIGDEKVSIYLADTLSGNNKVNTAVSVISRGIFSFSASLNYLKKRDKQWIAILIWQHLNSDNIPRQNRCNYPRGFTCKGCDKSGKSRETTEGKIYNNKAYRPSMDIGYKTLLTSKNKIMIHNSGQRGNKSVLFTDSVSIFECVKENNIFVSNLYTFRFLSSLSLCQKDMKQFIDEYVLNHPERNL